MAFELTITVPNNGDTFVLGGDPSGTYSATIDWDDASTSSITSYNDSDFSHTYASAGTYTIAITGTLTHLYAVGTQAQLDMVDTVDDFGSIGLVRFAFIGCSNLTSVVPGAGSASFTDLGISFKDCTSLETVGPLDCASVTDMGGAFTNTGAITSVVLQDIEVPFDITDNNLDATALNALFTGLADMTGETQPFLWVQGNPGEDSANTEIAMAKNWTLDHAIPNQSDTLGLTDSVDFLAPDSFADTMSLSDSMYMTLIETTFSQSDTINLSDLFQGIMLVSIASSVEVDDSFAPISVGMISDTLNLTDTITRTLKWIFSDTLEVSDSFSAAQRLALADTLALASVFSSQLVQTKYSIADSLAFTDSLQKIVREAIVDTFEVSDTITIGKVLETIADTLGISDQFLFTIQKSLSISSTLSLEDSLSLNYRWELEDTLEFADTLAWKIHNLMSLADSIEFTDEFSDTLSIQLMLSDSITLEDEFAWTVQKVLTIGDTFGIIGQFRLDGETFLVWAFNPKTFGSYKLKYLQNIRGMARIAGKNLIAMPDGIYEVGGDDDYGNALTPKFKTGMVNFNDPERHYPGENLKQLLEAYLLMTAEGETLLKVTTTRRGEGVEYWFKCREKPGVMARTQVPLSNSLRSVLFQFEIIPLKGKPAKFKQIHIVPLFLTRSI